MKSSELIVTGLSLGEDFCAFKNTFMLCGGNDYMVVDLLEFNDETMYKVKNKFGIEEAIGELRDVIMLKVIEAAKLESRAFRAMYKQDGEMISCCY